VAKFFREHDYWTRLGIHLDSRPLDDRPLREALEYDIIMDEIISAENSQHSGSRGNALPSRRH